MHDRRAEQHSTPTTEIALVAQAVNDLRVEVRSLDGKVDLISEKMMRAEGVLSVVRWLGVGGVSIAVLALARSFGVQI